MTITPQQIEAAHDAKRALLAAEQEHPHSKTLAILHARLGVLAGMFRSDMGEQDFQALGGGTGKEPG